MAFTKCVCLSGSQVKNLCSGVSRVAVCTLGVLYCHLQRAMDQEVQATAKVLLHKAAEINAVIRQEVDATLGHMVQHCTPTCCINALLVVGLRSVCCTHTHMHARTQHRLAHAVFHLVMFSSISTTVPFCLFFFFFFFFENF